MAANHFGIRAKKLTLLPFGAQVNIDCAFLPKRQQVLILLAGSAGNIAAVIFVSSFMWLFPAFFAFLGIFIGANMFTAILNLLPIYPLDSGKIIQVIGGNKTVRVLKIVSNVFFGILFAVGCFVWFNPALIILAICMIFTVNMESSCEYTSRLYKSRRAKSGVVREVAVRGDMTIFQVYKLVSHNHYTKFIITDVPASSLRGSHRSPFKEGGASRSEAGDVARQGFYENELEGYLLNHALDTKIMDIYTL